MTTSIRANIELSGCFVAVSSMAARISQQYLHIGHSHSCFSKMSRLPLIAAAREVKHRRLENRRSLIFSMSKNNEQTQGFEDDNDGGGFETYDYDMSDFRRSYELMEGGMGNYLISNGHPPYTVMRIDGVGAKLKLAFETGIYDTIGVDLVAMSVDGILTCGAKSLFMRIDLFTNGHDVDVVEKVKKGIVNGCKQCDCPLQEIQETDQGEYKEFHLKSALVGIVKTKDSLIDGKNIVAGDVLIGLPSSGVHSNGFFLIRQRILSQTGLSLNHQLPGEATTLGEALMTPTVIYAKQVQDIINKGGVKGIAHITDGGFTKKIPLALPHGLGAVIHKDSWEVPTVFKWIKEVGRIEDAEMRRTFNMGIGMVLVVTQEAAIRIIGDKANKSYLIGEVVNGRGVSYQ